MNKHTIELLVLDGQGVLFNDPLTTFFDDLADATHQDRASLHARWRDDLRERVWRGTIDEPSMWRVLVGEDDRDWTARLEASYRPGPAAAWLPRWAERVPIWLLTNHRTAWIEHRLVRFGLRRWLRRVLVSDAIGALKPERAVFEPALAHVSSPAAVLFVDDQEKNVRAAKAHGMTALLADPEGLWTFDVDLRLGGGPFVRDAAKR